MGRSLPKFTPVASWSSLLPSKPSILRTLHRTEDQERVSVLSRGFFFCSFYTNCAQFTSLSPSKGMLVVPPILASLASPSSLFVFFPSSHAFSRHPSLLCCTHPSRASTAYRPQRLDTFVGPSLYSLIHPRRRRCLYFHSTLTVFGAQRLT